MNPSPASQTRPHSLIPFAFITRFLQWGTLGFLIPVSGLIKLSKGLSIAELGFCGAIASGTIVLLEVPTGVFADRFGRKRTYLLSLAFTVAACLVILAGGGFFLVATGFILFGVARALSSGSLEALLIDRYIERRGEDSLARFMSTTNAADTAGLALGSLAGGVVPALWKGLMPEANRYHGNILAMIAMTAILALTVLVGVEEDHRTSSAKVPLRSFLRESVTFVRGSRTLIFLMVSMTAWGFAFSSIETYWQPRLATIMGSDASGWIFGTLSAGYFLFALLGSLAAPGALGKTQISPYSFLLITRLMTAAFVLILSFQNTVPGFSVFYLLMFFWNGLSNPPESTLLNRAIPPDRRASLLSMASLAVQLGGLAGSAVFGAVAGGISIEAAWIIAAVVFGASACLYIPLRAQNEGKNSRRT